jgi:hypothetical protein
MISLASLLSLTKGVTKCDTPKYTSISLSEAV